MRSTPPRSRVDASLRQNLHWGQGDHPHEARIMTHLLPSELPVELEAYAIDMALGAGAILNRHFGSPIEIEYKDKQKQDPVTTADKECQK